MKDFTEGELADLDTQGRKGHVGVGMGLILGLIISATMSITNAGKEFLMNNFLSFGFTEGTFDEFLKSHCDFSNKILNIQYFTKLLLTIASRRSLAWFFPVNMNKSLSMMDCSAGRASLYNLERCRKSPFKSTCSARRNPACC